MDPVFCKYVDQYDHTAIWPTNVPFPVEIKDGEARFHLETRGPWGLVSKCVGLAIERSDNGVKVWGPRSLLAPRESGYDLEGRVKVGGRTHRAFTSSQLFLVDGNLVNVAILYVCRKGA